MLLDPDTGCVMVGVVDSGSLTTLSDRTIDDDRGGWASPFVFPSNERQRLDLTLKQMRRRDGEDYLRQTLSWACELASQL